jgi:hypothetical protein
MDSQDILIKIGNLQRINVANVQFIERLLGNMNMIFKELKILESKVEDKKIITGLN